MWATDYQLALLHSFDNSKKTQEKGPQAGEMQKFVALS